MRLPGAIFALVLVLALITKPVQSSDTKGSNPFGAAQSKAKAQDSTGTATKDAASPPVGGDASPRPTNDVAKFVEGVGRCIDSGYHHGLVELERDDPPKYQKTPDKKLPAQVELQEQTEDYILGLLKGLKEDLLKHQVAFDKDFNNRKFNETYVAIQAYQAQATERIQRYTRLNLIAGASTLISNVYWLELSKELRLLHIMANVMYPSFYWLELCGPSDGKTRFATFCDPDNGIQMICEKGFAGAPFASPNMPSSGSRSVAPPVVPSDPKKIWAEIAQALFYPKFKQVGSREETVSEYISRVSEKYMPMLSSQADRQALDKVLVDTVTVQRVHAQKMEAEDKWLEAEIQKLQEASDRKRQGHTNERHSDLLKAFVDTNNKNAKEAASALKDMAEQAEKHKLEKVDKDVDTPIEDSVPKGKGKDDDTTPASTEEIDEDNLEDYQKIWNNQEAATLFLAEKMKADYNNIGAKALGCHNFRRESISAIPGHISSIQEKAKKTYLDIIRVVSNEQGSGSFPQFGEAADAVKNVCDTDKIVFNKLRDVQEQMSVISEIIGEQIENSISRTADKELDTERLDDVTCYISHFTNMARNIFTNMLTLRSQWEFSEYSMLSSLSVKYHMSFNCPMQALSDHALSFVEGDSDDDDKFPARTCPPRETKCDMGEIDIGDQKVMAASDQAVKVTVPNMQAGGVYRCVYKRSMAPLWIAGGENNIETLYREGEVSGNVVSCDPPIGEGLWFVSVDAALQDLPCHCAGQYSKSIIFPPANGAANGGRCPLPDWYTKVNSIALTGYSSGKEVDTVDGFPVVVMAKPDGPNANNVADTDHSPSVSDAATAFVKEVEGKKVQVKMWLEPDKNCNLGTWSRRMQYLLGDNTYGDTASIDKEFVYSTAENFNVIMPKHDCDFYMYLTAGPAGEDTCQFPIGAMDNFAHFPYVLHYKYKPKVIGDDNGSGSGNTPAVNPDGKTTGDDKPAGGDKPVVSPDGTTMGDGDKPAATPAADSKETVPGKRDSPFITFNSPSLMKALDDAVDIHCTVFKASRSGEESESCKSVKKNGLQAQIEFDPGKLTVTHAVLEWNDGASHELKVDLNGKPVADKAPGKYNANTEEVSTKVSNADTMLVDCIPEDETSVAEIKSKTTGNACAIESCNAGEAQCSTIKKLQGDSKSEIVVKLMGATVAPTTVNIAYTAKGGEKKDFEIDIAQ